MLTLVALRGLCVLALAAMLALALGRLAAPSAADLSRRLLTDGPQSLAELPFDAALVGICSAVLVLCCVWVVLVTAQLVIQVVVHAARFESADSRWIPGVTARMCPRLAQRIVLTGCGVALTTGLATGLASPATADQSSPLGGLAMPDRTVGSPVSEPRRVRVTVTAGASLWSIAEAALPDQAGNTEITAAWHAIHRANAQRIGNDPDLIFSGTTLQIPRLNEPDRKDHP